MRKHIFAVVSVVALSIALPAAAQYQQPDQNRRGDDTQFRDRDGDRVSQDLAVADRRLNQLYQRRIFEARAADRAAGRDGHYNRNGDGRPDDRYGRARDWYSQEAALREAERNWIAYRDADCRYMAQPDVGRRSYNGSLRSCLLDHTTDRIAVLRDARMDVSSR